MRPPDPDRFHSLPALTVAKFLEMEAGEVVKLGLLEYVQTPDPDFSPGVVFEVEYEHDRVEFRTPGQKDAVAFGRGKLESQPNWEPCRILFSQYHRTATMRGMVLDGPVKLLEIPTGPLGLEMEDQVMSDQKFPWDKHAVSPEAKALIARAEAHAASERASKRHPMRLRDYMVIGGAIVALVGIPALLISFFF